MSKARELSQRAGVDGALSNRNMIINGAMQVAQRGTSVSGSSANGYHTVDRWRQVVDSGAGSFTLSASTDAPSGFSNSEKIEITAGGSKLTALTSYLFEGQDLQRLGFGTASASPVTLSFWVKSNVVGTYTAELYNATSVRQVSKTYSIDASGVWEYKEITFPADASNGFANNNQTGMYLFFWKQAASTFTSGTQNTSAWASATDANRVNASIPHFSASAGNYFQITGVQLEVGDTATPFEHRSYGQELALCQRFFCTSGGTQVVPQFTGYDDDFFVEGVGAVYTNDLAYSNRINWPVPMRARPTVTIVSNSLCSAANQAVVYSRNGGWNTCDVTAPNAGTTGMMIDLRDNGGFVNRDSCMYFVGYYADAEL